MGHQAAKNVVKMKVKRKKGGLFEFTKGIGVALINLLLLERGANFKFCSLGWKLVCMTETLYLFFLRNSSSWQRMSIVFCLPDYMSFKFESSSFLNFYLSFIISFNLIEQLDFRPSFFCCSMFFYLLFGVSWNYELLLPTILG